MSNPRPWTNGRRRRNGKKRQTACWQGQSRVLARGEFHQLFVPRKTLCPAFVAAAPALETLPPAPVLSLVTRTPAQASTETSTEKVEYQRHQTIDHREKKSHTRVTYLPRLPPSLSFFFLILSRIEMRGKWHAAVTHLSLSWL